MVLLLGVYAVGAVLGGMSSVRWGASVLFGAKLVDDQVTLEKNSRERRIDINSEKSKEDGWVVISFSRDDLPESLCPLAGEHWVTVQEREALCLAMDRVASGHTSSFDFGRFLRTQEDRKADRVLRRALGK
jgi:hypothetical protein